MQHRTATDSLADGGRLYVTVFVAMFTVEHWPVGRATAPARTYSMYSMDEVPLMLTVSHEVRLNVPIVAKHLQTHFATSVALLSCPLYTRMNSVRPSSAQLMSIASIG